MSLYDTPLFAWEKPFIQRFKQWSDDTLTMLLIIGAIVLIWVALSPRSSLSLKALALAYVVLP